MVSHDCLSNEYCISQYLILYISGNVFSSVPTGSPLDVEVQSVTSTSATVSWREPSPDQQNGAIVAYSLSVDNAKDHLKWTVNSTATYISGAIIAPLEPFTTYSLSVSAVNVNGSGPFSLPIKFTTAHAGISTVTCNITIFLLLMLKYFRSPPSSSTQSHSQQYYITYNVHDLASSPT